MLITLLLLSILLSSIFITASHPVSLLVLITMQTLTTASLICTSQKSPWFSFILFLVFLGGMLVLFSYITSLASNYQFKLSLAPPLLALFISLALTPLLAPPLAPGPPQSFTLMTNKIIFQSSSMTMALIFYLLIALFVVVKISTFILGPLQYQK